jgi:hypothetical protein
MVFNSPLTDVRQPSEILTDGSYRNQSNTKSYLIKIGEFQERLKLDTVFFQDLSGLTWTELFIQACITPLPARLAYFNEAAKRARDRQPPNFSSIDKFIEELPKATADPKAIEKIAADHYLFFM